MKESLSRDAKRIYEMVCKTLEENDLKYQKDDEDLSVEFTISSEDLPVDFRLVVDESNQALACLSHLQFKTKEENRAQMAASVVALNYVLSQGVFDFNFVTGGLLYRAAIPFLSSVLSPKAIMSLITLTYNVVSDYNDKLFLVAIGANDFEAFCKTMEKMIGGEDDE